MSDNGDDGSTDLDCFRERMTARSTSTTGCTCGDDYDENHITRSDGDDSLYMYFDIDDDDGYPILHLTMAVSVGDGDNCDVILYAREPGMADQGAIASRATMRLEELWDFMDGDVDGDVDGAGNGVGASGIQGICTQIVYVLHIDMNTLIEAIRLALQDCMVEEVA